MGKRVIRLMFVIIYVTGQGTKKIDKQPWKTLQTTTRNMWKWETPKQEEIKDKKTLVA
jgi:hypothetical protein